VIYILQAFNLEFANHHATVDGDEEQSCSQQRKRMSSASEELLEIEKKKLTIFVEDLIRKEWLKLFERNMKIAKTAYK